MGISSQFSPIFLSFWSHYCTIFLNHTPPQPSTTPILRAMSHSSPVSPHFSPAPPLQFFSILPIFPFCPFFQAPKSWFGELVSW